MTRTNSAGFRRYSRPTAMQSEKNIHREGAKNARTTNTKLFALVQNLKIFFATFAPSRFQYFGSLVPC